MEDWKSAHLTFLWKHKNFIPKHAQDYTESYYDIMKEVYNHPACSQEYARKMYLADLEWQKKSQKLEIELLKQLDTKSTHFITIGFNHQTWTVSKVKDIIERILCCDWISKCRIVFEYYRTNGEHPHIHILMDSVLAKSKILEKIWALKGIKKIVLSKSFIDYKVAGYQHTAYIAGEKTEDKMKYVQMDKEFRKQNAIEDYYEK